MIKLISVSLIGTLVFYASRPCHAANMAFYVSIETGPRAGQVFSGEFTYDPNGLVFGINDYHPITSITFDFGGHSYTTADNETSPIAFRSEIFDGGSSVYLYGIENYFVADSANDVGFNFQGSTNQPVPKSQFFYGDQVIHNNPFNGGAGFSTLGAGEVTYHMIPEPTSFAIAVPGLLSLIFYHSRQNRR